VPQKKLLEAMRYSLLAGGKRIRPVLLLKFCQAAGGDMDKALPMACAVEMLHTYSLIHDDLPCMDDDVLRRGKPTCHVAYGEYTATLAGDALQASAFRTLLTADLAPDILASAGAVLAYAAGEEGICGGQYLDMEAEGRDLGIEELTLVHSLKTAAMLKAAAEMGVLAAGGKAEQFQREAALRYAEAAGLAFQVRDDMLNRTSSAEILGKPVFSDISRGKSTFVSLIGLDACQRLVQEKTEEAIGAIKGKFSDTGFLEWFALWLAGREN
jgi:geranylgeranyl diphosphate synthase type II